MDKDHITNAELTPVVEVLHITTQGTVDIIHPGARDVVDPGARPIKEKIGTNNGVNMPRKATNGISHRSMVIVVSTSTFYLQMELLKYMARLDEFKV